MRATKLLAVVLCLVGGVIISLGTAEGKIKFKSRSIPPEVIKFSNAALKYAQSKSADLKQMKSFIDSAELACRRNDIEIPAILHLARANFFLRTNDFIHSAQEGSLALRMSQKTGDKETEIRALTFLGQYNFRTKGFKQSLENFNASIALEKKFNVPGLVAQNYLGIANVYRSIGDTLTYRNSLKTAIAVAKKENDSSLLKIAYYMLGSSLTEHVRDFKKADSLLNQSLKIALVQKDTTYIASSLANMGWNFYKEKKYESAIKFYNKSLVYSLPSWDHGTSSNSLGNLGTIYRDLGENERSIKYYNKAIAQGMISNDIGNLWWIYNDMSQLYLNMGDTAKAFKSYVMFKKFSDALMRTSNYEGLSDARIQYEAESQNREFELLSLRVKNQRLLIYGSSGLFILSIAVLLLLLSRSRLKAKRRISEMNRKVAEITQANLRQQMNPHFIFNTLNSIQYYMYQHDKLATNNYLTKFSSLMRKVLENSQHTSVPLRDELDALNLYLELEQIRFKDKFDYEIKVDEDIDPLLFKVPTMLIQPYVENSISHGLIPALCKGTVKIQLHLENEYISCTIEDNGIGRDAALVKKRNGEVAHNSLGTQITSSRLDLVNTLYGTSLKTVYTDLKNEKGEPEGTRVEIHIPILS